jgi:hypothetical protein
MVTLPRYPLATKCDCWALGQCETKVFARLRLGCEGVL